MGKEKKTSQELSCYRKFLQNYAKTCNASEYPSKERLYSSVPNNAIKCLTLKKVPTSGPILYYPSRNNAFVLTCKTFQN